MIPRWFTGPWWSHLPRRLRPRRTVVGVDITAVKAVCRDLGIAVDDGQRDALRRAYRVRPLTAAEFVARTQRAETAALRRSGQQWFARSLDAAVGRVVAHVTAITPPLWTVNRDPCPVCGERPTGLSTSCDVSGPVASTARVHVARSFLIPCGHEVTAVDVGLSPSFPPGQP